MLAQKIVAPVANNLAFSNLLVKATSFRYISSKPLNDYKTSLLTKQPNISSLKLHTYLTGKMSWIWLRDGTKSAWHDLQTFTTLRKIPPNLRTAYQTIQLQRIKKDLIKLIPFSFFVVVPFSELVLPFYLYFLPNSTPTCYRFDTSQEREVREFEGKRDEAYRYFIGKLKKEGNFKLDDIQPSELRLKLAEGDNKGTNIYSLTSDELIMLCDFLGVKEYKTGTNIVNRTANLFSYYLPTFLSIPWNLLTRSKNQPLVNWQRFKPYKDLPIMKFNYSFFEKLKRFYLLSQISKHMGNVKKVDSKLLTDGSVEYGPETLEEFRRARGISSASPKQTLRKEWIGFSADPKTDLNQTVLYSLILHHHLQQCAMMAETVTPPVTPVPATVLTP